jgi:hypothetical protein
MALRWKYETWRKLYVREQGSFAQLPLMARALAKQLLCYVDDDGRIALGGREPIEALIFRAGGGDLNDRRALRKYVPMLLADGYLVRDGDALRIRNFGPAQHGTDRVQVLDIDSTATRPELDRDSTPKVSIESQVASQIDDREVDSTETRPRLDGDSTKELSVGDCSGSLRSSFREEDQSQSLTRDPRSTEPGVRAEAAETAREARKAVRDQCWHDFRACLDALAAEGIGRGSKALQVEPGQTLLVALISLADSNGTLPDVLGNVRHALAVRMAEVRSDPKTLRYFSGLMFESASFSRTVARQLSEFPSRFVKPMAWEAKKPIAEASPSEDDWDGIAIWNLETMSEWLVETNRRTGEHRSGPMPDRDAPRGAARGAA